LFDNYRKYQRHSICAKAFITRRDEGPSEKLTAQVITISQGGMGFYASESLEKSTPVLIELLTGTAGGTEFLEGQIASICPLENDYFVGISFAREISHDRFVEIIG
jgi:hypothetical protein